MTTEAEKALEALEGPLHRAKHAAHTHATLKAMTVADHPKMKAAHAEAVTESQAEVSAADGARAMHESVHGGPGKLQRKIDTAAQAVLDERGEKHTDQPKKANANVQ